MDTKVLLGPRIFSELRPTACNPHGNLVIACRPYLQFGDQGTETRGVEATLPSHVTPQPSDLVL